MRDCSIAKSGAAYDDFLRAPGKNFLGARDTADSTAHANLHFCATRQKFDPAAVRAGADRGVQVNQMQDWIIAEAVEQAEYIVNRKRPVPAANQLNGFAALQINAGNDHGFV